MFTKMHHVTDVVESLDEMEAYLDRDFALKPIRRDEFTEQGFKSLLYQAGDTLVDYSLRDDNTMAQQLRETGPGVHTCRLGRRWYL